jgi:hypothetical protein
MRVVESCIVGEKFAFRGFDFDFCRFDSVDEAGEPGERQRRAVVVHVCQKHEVVFLSEEDQERPSRLSPLFRTTWVTRMWLENFQASSFVVFIHDEQLHNFDEYNEVGKVEHQYFSLDHQNTKKIVRD